MVTVSCFSIIFVFDHDQDEENLAVNMSTRAESRSGNARKTKTASPTVCNTFDLRLRFLVFLAIKIIANRELVKKKHLHCKHKSEVEKRRKANKLEAVLVKTSLQNKNLRTFSNSERHRFGGGIVIRNTTIANSQMHFTNAIYRFFFGIFLMVENFADEDHLMFSTFEGNCSSQPSIVHWLSSSIFPFCSSFVRPAMVTSDQISTSTSPRPPNPYIF